MNAPDNLDVAGRAGQLAALLHLIINEHVDLRDLERQDRVSRLLDLAADIAKEIADVLDDRADLAAA